MFGVIMLGVNIEFSTYVVKWKLVLKIFDAGIYNLLLYLILVVAASSNILHLICTIYSNESAIFYPSNIYTYYGI